MLCCQLCCVLAATAVAAAAAAACEGYSAEGCCHNLWSQTQPPDVPSLLIYFLVIPSSFLASLCLLEMWCNQEGYHHKDSASDQVVGLWSWYIRSDSRNEQIMPLHLVSGTPCVSANPLYTWLTFRVSLSRPQTACCSLKAAVLHTWSFGGSRSGVGLLGCALVSGGNRFFGGNRFWQEQAFPPVFGGNINGTHSCCGMYAGQQWWRDHLGGKGAAGRSCQRSSLHRCLRPPHQPVSLLPPPPPTPL